MKIFGWILYSMCWPFHIIRKIADSTFLLIFPEILFGVTTVLLILGLIIDRVRGYQSSAGELIFILFIWGTIAIIGFLALQYVLEVVSVWLLFILQPFEICFQYANSWRKGKNQKKQYNNSSFDEEQKRKNTAENENINDALNLFGLNEGYTMEQLKKQRNIILKKIHPDQIGDEGTAYAQRINGAYRILKEHLDA